MNKIEEEIALMNKIIEAAIWYGADRGGAYQQDENGLKHAIDLWLEYKGLSNSYFVSESERGWLTIKKI